jgi:hypothetical protein
MMTEALKLSPKTRLVLAAAVLAVAAAFPKHGFAATAPAGDAQVAEDANYDVKTEVVGDCLAGKECTAKITITSKGEFHVNDTYPFKFTAEAANVEFHGSGGNVFTGADFAREKTKGTMTVKFKPSAKGAVTITGKYKICICSNQICAPSTIDVAIPVTVK